MGPARRRGFGVGARRGGALLGALLAVAPVWAATPPAAVPAAAPANVLYRCTAANGGVALQDEPCPAGQKQEVREIAAFVPSSPPAEAAAIVPPPDAEAADASPPPPVITAGDATPPRRSVVPPPLWRCTDLNGRSRLAEVYDPQPRCVPLSVLGVDLSRAPPSAATLCRTIEDDCVELRGEAACAAWEERLAEAESALRQAFSDTQAQRRRERDHAKAVVANDCRD